MRDEGCRPCGMVRGHEKQGIVRPRAVVARRVLRPAESQHKTTPAGPSNKTPVHSWKLYQNPFYQRVAAAAMAIVAPKAVADTVDQANGHIVREAGPRENEGEVVREAGPCNGDAGFATAGDGRPLISLFVELRQQEKVPASAAHPPLLLHPSPKSKNLSNPNPLVYSPCSPLQPRRSSFSDSPDSPSQRTQQGASMPISPPLKNITLIRPAHVADPSHLHHHTFPSSHLSPSQIIQMEHMSDHFLDTFKLPKVGLVTSPLDPFESLGSPWHYHDDDGSPSLISSLQLELQRAHARVQELEMIQILARRDVANILNKCANEQEMLQSRLQEKIKAAVLPINEELEKEKKAKKKLESENRRLSIHLTEAIKANEEAERELDNERKSRELMEGVCDELAREIRQDKAEMEELKREHAQAQEELEEERRMLQMSEAWREERIQMKLLEAGLEIEGRCMALDEVRNELTTFLSAWKSEAEGRLTRGYDVGHAHGLLCAVEEAQAQAFTPLCLPEGNTGYSLLSLDGALMSDEVEFIQDAPHSHSKDEGKSVVDPEPKWASSECDSHASDDSERGVGSNVGAHFHNGAKQWTNRKDSFRNRKAALRWNGSKRHGLDRLKNRDEGVEETGYQGNMVNSYFCEGKIRDNCAFEDNRNWTIVASDQMGGDGSDDGWLEHHHHSATASTARHGNGYTRSSFPLEHDEEMVLVSGMHKQFIGNPNYMLRKASCPLPEEENQSISHGRGAHVEGPLEFSKPFRSNSFKASILVEDNQTRLQNGSKNIR